MQSLKLFPNFNIPSFFQNLPTTVSKVPRFYWMAGLAGILLPAALLVLFIVRRRSGKPGPTGSRDTKHKALSRTSLFRAWEEFLRELPAKFRRSIMLYQPFVVLGESGAGKSLIVDSFTDWQALANQFYPSHTANPLLQIYLGSKVVVQEISASLLADNSKQARAALLRLWKPLFTVKEPVVVIVLNAQALQSDTLEALKKRAQMMRGKINLIALVRQKPVKVCIVLTHLDQIEGFSEFSGFLRQNNIPLRFEFAAKNDVQNIQTCLEPYENYLSLALTTLPARDYMKIISFFRQAPELLSTLSTFNKILQCPDPLSPEPEIIRLSLASQGGREEDNTVSNPFAPPPSLKAVPYDPLSKHRQAAAALLIIGLLYLGSGYFAERYFLTRFEQDMNTLEALPPVQYNEKIHSLLLECTARLRHHPLLSLFPDFFPHADETNCRRLIKNIREFYLLPELKQGKYGNEPERVVYLLSLIYGSQHNNLGKFILDHISEWKKRFRFPDLLIEDYLKYNDSHQEIVIADDIHLMIPPPTANFERWTLFFRKALNASHNSFINQAELQGLQRESGLIMADIKEYEYYDFLMKICDLLREEAPSAPHPPGAYRDEDPSARKQKSLLEFLDFIQQLDMEYPEVESMPLRQFLESIKTLNAIRRNEEEKRFQFTFAREDFAFTSREWNELVDRSRMTLFMHQFIKQNSMHNGRVFFFDGETSYPDILMNPGNDGLLFFTGKGKVDGLYTRAAFEDAIKPILLELPGLLEKLAVAKEVKTMFSSFISREVKAYAEEYASQYRTYYQQFRIKASSPGELQVILKQVQLPSSPFQDFLLTVKENTGLELEENPYFQTFSSKLHTFDFIQRVMLERKGAFPEFDKYKDILGQMQEDMKGDKGFIAKNEMDESNELKRQLSPLGRISLAIFRGEEDSYLNMVEKWLKHVEMGHEWQDIFRAPVRDAYLLGLAEVQEKVDQVSGELWASNVQPVMRKFPFDREAANEVSLAELKALVHPRGKFWETFQKCLGPVCLKVNNTWVQRTAPLGSIQVPRNMLDTVNEIIRIRETFWDENGLPRTIKFSIKPYLLPANGIGKPIAILSYLRSGKSAAFGFNQQPAWQDFEFEWWKEQSAIIGVEYTTSINSRKNYKAITAPESCWSLYQLLRMAEPVGNNVFMWRIKGAVSSYSGNLFTVKFAMKTDPWALFQLTQPKVQELSAQ